MKLARLNPFLPREPRARAAFASAYQKELREYRKRPTFWVSMLVVFVCGLALVWHTETVGRLLLLVIVVALALAHDTITSHFTRRLLDLKRTREE